MKSSYSKEIKIGVAAIVCLVLLYVGIEFLKGVNIFKPGNYYIVKYENVTGLSISAPVTINGYKVGLVRDITYDAESTDGTMIVELNLNKNIKIPKGSVALLASDLLGTASIQLQLNSAPNPTEYYPVGAQLPGNSVSGFMGELDSKIMPAINMILPKIDTLIANLNSITGNPALMNSIKRIEPIMENLEATTASLNKMMKNQVPQTLNNVNTITQNVNMITSDLAEVSSNLKQLPLDSTMQNLNSTLENVNYITGQLKGKDSSIGLLLNDKGLYDNINGTIKDLDSIMIDIRHNPKKYVNFKLF